MHLIGCYLDIWQVQTIAKENKNVGIKVMLIQCFILLFLSLPIFFFSSNNLLTKMIIFPLTPVVLGFSNIGASWFSSDLTDQPVSDSLLVSPHFPNL